VYIEVKDPPPPYTHGATVTSVQGASSLLGLHYHTHTHKTLYDFSGRVISPKQSPLTDDTQHGPGGIRARNPSTQEASDSRLRQRDHFDVTGYVYK